MDWYDVRFGETVAFLGEDVLVGSPFDTAHLFDGITGTLLETFVDPIRPGLIDGFAEAIAVLGDGVLVGVPSQHVGFGRGGGEAYLFDPTNGDLLHTYVNPAYSGGFVEKFGHSIAALGSNVLIGGPRVDTADENAGAAYLFNRRGILLQTFLDPSPSVGGEFGFAVAALGGNALVGAPFDTNVSSDGGAVYLFDSSTGALLRTFSNPTPNAGDEFGWSLATSDSHVLISAPQDDTVGPNAGAVYLFDGATGALLRTYTNPRPDFEFIRDEFGASMAFVGEHVLIGAPWEGGIDGAGVVYLFHVSAGALKETLMAPDPTLGPHSFGRSLATQGARILVGAPGRGGDPGVAYLYTLSRVILTESDDSTVVVEGGSADSYELVLLTQPATEVMITLAPSDQVDVTPSSLSFTPTDWDRAKTVTVTAVDDAVEEGNHTAAIDHAASGADLGYNGLTVPNVTVLIIDNDVPPEPARVGPEPLIVLLAVVVGIWVSAAVISLRSRPARRRKR